MMESAWQGCVGMGERLTVGSASAATHRKNGGRSITSKRRPVLGLRPHTPPFEVFTSRPAEIVIGLVGPIGTDNAKIYEFISERLKEYGYTPKPISISRT